MDDEGLGAFVAMERKTDIRLSGDGMNATHVKRHGGHPGSNLFDEDSESHVEFEDLTLDANTYAGELAELTNLADLRFTNARIKSPDDAFGYGETKSTRWNPPPARGNENANPHPLFVGLAVRQEANVRWNGLT